MVKLGPRRRPLISNLLALSLCFATAHTQSISTGTPLPPLQWINITNLIGGSPVAPPLKDASIGYDDNTRTLLIFGGESQQGIPQSQTYLLDLQTLSWFSLQSPPGLTSVPPARTLALSGLDSAASYRHGHIVIGGQGTNGSPLSDVWEFDFTSRFWNEVNIVGSQPSARYGAVGGIDSRLSFTPAAGTASAPNNTFYLSGGIDPNTVEPLSDVWRLNISGVLSSNNIDQTFGSWDQISFGSSNAPPKVGPSGTVVSDEIIAIGGCSSTSANQTCAEQDSYIINISAETISNPSGCPAPRNGATVVPNFNEVSSSAGSQVFMLLGTVNTSLWDDQGGLEKGEVDVFDVNTGGWTRVLPAGDPGPSGTGRPAFPSPREGAVAIAAGTTLVGSQSSIASDTLVFGGRDASGNYLNEIWILRAYNATLTRTNQTWSSFINDDLQGGPNANGQGVTIQYLTQCASAIGHVPTPTLSSFSSSPSKTQDIPGPQSSGSQSTSSPIPTYDTSAIHKSLSPISIALVLPAVVFYRLYMPSVAPAQLEHRHSMLLYSSFVAGVASFAVGVVGLVSSFTSISTTMALMKRSSSSLILKTDHGRAGLALFVALYALVPLLWLLQVFCKRGEDDGGMMSRSGSHRMRTNSTGTAEKLRLVNGRHASPARPSTEALSTQDIAEPRPRVRSWAGGLSSWTFPGRRSSDSGVDDGSTSPPPSQSFEVVNRPVRTRRASANSLAAFSDPRPSGYPRNLSDMSWLDKRRSSNTMAEPDFTVNHLQRRANDSSTPGTIVMDSMSTAGLVPAAALMSSAQMPSPFETALHLLFHALVFALCILSLVMFWMHGPRAAFAIFLAWTALFYAIVVTLAWHGRPRVSILTVFISRLRAGPPHPSPPIVTPSPSRPLSAAGSEPAFPLDGRGPYQHHPPFRATLSAGLDHEYPASLSHGHGTVEVDDDEDVDEDTRQRRIEEEMARRDVSIVTVPKRKLFLTNPEQNSTDS
ncbi:hypothetical protein OBBRIDRAFT_792792 [Obba rivulosa]|uniref:Galactose oxidase n=1 Tax=Obba rivulosa TaxID=1052685 RepID=A0A8E2B2F6_9APHY|nr:hypothetical protein OBBRIDRAFT_792792 [Obba rivulosa]